MPNAGDNQEAGAKINTRNMIDSATILVLNFNPEASQLFGLFGELWSSFSYGAYRIV